MKKITIFKKSITNEELERLEEMLRNEEPCGERYAILLSRIEDLKSINNKNRVSSDTIAIIASQIVCLLLVIFAEDTRILSKNAMQWIVRGRI